MHNGGIVYDASAFCACFVIISSMYCKESERNWEYCEPLVHNAIIILHEIFISEYLKINASLIPTTLMENNILCYWYF